MLPVVRCEFRVLAIQLLLVSSVCTREYVPDYDEDSKLVLSNLRPGHGQASEDKVERKITILVSDEESSPPIITDTSSYDKPRSKSTVAIDADQTDTKILIDETTRLIYIDETNESGLLIGDIKTAIDDTEANTRRSRDGGRSLKNPQAGSKQRQGQQGNSPTNYSLFLVSRNPSHLAILLDVESINFEPIINCESQELRFSIVGEISKQLLTSEEEQQDEVTNEGEQDEEDGDDYSDQDGDDDSSSESGAKSASTSSESQNPPLPVSEAMAMLLNSPLNQTILDDSDEMNDFKLIDSVIDYLHEETCKAVSSKETSRARSYDSRNRKSHHRSIQKRKNTRRHRRQKRKKARKPECSPLSPQFKDQMAAKLNDFFEWDDFKIVCGKIKQLVVPMRSMKISVYSDEFAPNSNFTLRYRFIRDSSLLPAHDNGKYFCRNRNIIDLAQRCDGVDDCGDASDESIKICGYPTSRSSDPLGQTVASTSTSGQRRNKMPGDKSRSRRVNSPMKPSSVMISSDNRRRLTYFNGDVLHCCQSNDWISATSQGQANQMMNLQSLIGESMKLFSGPLFAPTSSGRQQAPEQSKAKRRFKRIVGGSEAPKGAWPGQASLEYELLEPLCHFCAGTLIHPMYVLTAGHCITKDGLNRGIKLVFGAHDLRNMNGNHVQVRYVDDAHIYPGVDVKHLSFDWENDMNNDIALIRLNAPVLVTPHVAPACLPPFNTPLAVNTTCRSIGWGQTHGSGSSNLLKHLSLKVVESSTCSKELLDKDNDNGKKKSSVRRPPTDRRGATLVSEYESANFEQYSNQTMICVNNDLGHGICQGDSGGPLYCERTLSNGDHCTEIYGVASFIIQYATVGAMCAVENLPGIFGEVSSKTEWISSTIKMFEQSYRLKYS